MRAVVIERFNEYEVWLCTDDARDVYNFHEATFTTRSAAIAHARRINNG